MTYYFLSFLSVLLFALVHLFADTTRFWSRRAQSTFLSIGGGIALSYVFIDLLPKLAKNNSVVAQFFSGFLPYIEKHAYVMALAGFLLFYISSQGSSFLNKKHSFYFSLYSYALFNFMVGYAVVDKNNPEVRPLFLFTLAIALHYFANDFSLNKSHGKKYDQSGRWILIASLFIGWCMGLFVQLPQSAVAMVSAFVGGGVIMNVMRHELPEENPHNLYGLILGAVFYALLLLGIG